MRAEPAGGERNSPVRGASNGEGRSNGDGRFNVARVLGPGISGIIIIEGNCMVTGVEPDGHA